MAEESRGAGRRARLRRLLREEAGALTAEWALGAAVVVTVGALSLGGLWGGVLQAASSIEAGLLLQRDEKDAVQRMQEELAQLRKEMDEANDRSAFDDFVDFLTGDDDGAEGPAASRLEAASKASSYWDDDDD